MKAKMEVNATIIQEALVKYFASMGASKAELKTQRNEDWYGGTLPPTIYAEVEIDVGEAVAY